MKWGGAVYLLIDVQFHICGVAVSRTAKALLEITACQA